MSYKGLEKARVERAAKDAVKEAKKAEREAKKAEKEAKKAAKVAEEATAGKKSLGRTKLPQECKSLVEADAPKPKPNVAWMSGPQVAEDGNAPGLWRAPMARMY